MNGRHGWRMRLRGLGYRVTLPRQAVLAELEKADGHLTAKDIFIRVQELYPACGFNTVYRTLDMLVSAGIVNRLDFGDGQAHFELVSRTGSKPRHHHHILCVNCGKVVDYDDFMDEEELFFGKVVKYLSKKFDFNITDHELTFKGLCGECSRLKAAGAQNRR